MSTELCLAPLNQDGLGLIKERGVWDLLRVEIKNGESHKDCLCKGLAKKLFISEKAFYIEGYYTTLKHLENKKESIIYFGRVEGLPNKSKIEYIKNFNGGNYLSKLAFKLIQGLNDFVGNFLKESKRKYELGYEKNFIKREDFSPLVLTLVHKLRVDNFLE